MTALAPGAREAFELLLGCKNFAPNPTFLGRRPRRRPSLGMYYAVRTVVDDCGFCRCYLYGVRDARARPANSKTEGTHHDSYFEWFDTAEAAKAHIERGGYREE